MRTNNMQAAQKCRVRKRECFRIRILAADKVELEVVDEDAALGVAAGERLVHEPIHDGFHLVYLTAPDLLKQDGGIWHVFD